MGLDLGALLEVMGGNLGALLGVVMGDLSSLLEIVGWGDLGILLEVVGVGDLGALLARGLPEVEAAPLCPQSSGPNQTWLSRSAEKTTLFN